MNINRIDHILEEKFNLSQLTDAVFKPKKLAVCIQLFLASTVLSSPISFANIETGGQFAPTIITQKNAQQGTTSNIFSNHKINNNAFNTFNKFNINQNDIANLHLDDDVNKLHNFVNSKIDIQGTVNAIKNKKISGELFFYSKDGFVVGNKGVVNAGSLIVQTPNASTMTDIMQESDISKLAGLTDQLERGNVALNADATIQVKGQINTTDDLVLKAGKININGESSTAKAKLQTGIVAFENLVNMGVVDQNNKAILLEQPLQVITDAKGNIQLVAEANVDDKNHQIASIIIGKNSQIQSENDTTIEATAKKVLTKTRTNATSIGLKGMLGFYGVDENLSTEAKVEVLGDIQAKGTVNVDANSHLELRAVGIQAANIETSSKANINITGTIISDQDINLKAHSINNSQIITEYISNDGIQPGGNQVLPIVGFSGQIVDNTSHADLTVASNAKIIAKENVSVKALSDNNLISTTKTNIEEKKRGDIGVGVAFNLTDFDSHAIVNIDGEIEATSGSIDILAHDILHQNEIEANAKIKSDKEKNPDDKKVETEADDKADDWRINQLFDYAQEKTDKLLGGFTTALDMFNEKTHLPSPALELFFKASGAVNILDENKLAQVNIGQNATLTAHDNLNLNANAILGEKFRVAATASSTAKKDDAGFSAGAAVALSNLKNNSNIHINESVKLKALNGEMQILAESGKVLSSKIGFEVSNLADLKKENLAKVTGLLDTHFEAASSAEVAGKQTTAIGGSGSVLISDIENNSHIMINKNAELAAKNGIDIKARNAIALFSKGGSSSSVSEDSKGIGIGGTYVQQDIHTNANVHIQDGVKLITDAQEAKNQINIKATNENALLTALVGSGTSTGLSLTGMVSMLNGESKANIDIANSSLDADSIDIQSVNEDYVINAVGTLVSTNGEASTLGASVAFNNYTLESNSILHGEKTKIATNNIDIHALNSAMLSSISVTGEQDAIDDTDPKSNLQQFIKLVQNVSNVPATIEQVTGAIGAVEDVIERATGESNPKQIAQEFSNEKDKLVEAGTDAEKLKQGSASSNQNLRNATTLSTSNDDKSKFTLNALGSVSLNIVEKETTAMLKDANISLRNNDSKLAIQSTDNTWIAALSGAGAMTTAGESTTVGIAGSAAINHIKGNTASLLENNKINNAKQIDVLSVNIGSQIATGLGLKVDTTKKGIEVAGSGSVNLIDQAVSAKLKNNIINENQNNIANETDIDVLAYTDDLQVTGGISINFAKKANAIGANVSFADVKNDVEAIIEGGNHQNIKDVDVTAGFNATQISTAVGVAISTNENALNGSFVYNHLNNKINSTIKDSTIQQSGHTHINAGTLTTEQYKHTRDDTQSLNTGINIQVKDVISEGYNKAKDVIVDNIPEVVDEKIIQPLVGLIPKKTDKDQSPEDTEEKVKSVDVEPNIGGRIITSAAAISGSDEVSGAGAVNVQNITNHLNAGMSNSTIEQIQPSTIHVASDADIFMLNIVGGAAVSSEFAGLGSILVQDLNQVAHANIDSSNILQNIQESSLKVNAANNNHVINIIGQISGGSDVALGGTFGKHNIYTSTQADITNHLNLDQKLTSNNVSVIAENTSKQLNITGILAASKEFAMAGAINLNHVRDDIRAEVTGQKQLETYSLTLDAQNKTNLGSIVAGLTLSKDITGGVSSAINRISGETKTSIENIALISDQDDIEKKIISTANDEGTVRSLVSMNGIGRSGAIAASIASNDIDKDVVNHLKTSKIENIKTNIDLKALNDGDIAGFVGGVSASADIAANVAITLNDINNSTSTQVEQSHLEVQNLKLLANDKNEISSISAGLGASNQLAGTGSAAINHIHSNTTAEIIKDSHIVAENNVAVLAESDKTINNYIGAISVGIGQGALGASMGWNKITGQTQANINGEHTKVTAKALNPQEKVALNTLGNSQSNSLENLKNAFNTKSNISKVNDKSVQGVVVDASSANSIKSFLVSGGIGGNVAIAANVDLNTIGGETSANIHQAHINDAEHYADLHINAQDASEITEVIASAAISKNAAVSGLVGVNNFERKTSATIENADISAKNIDLRADSKQKASVGTADLNAAVTMYGGAVGVAASKIQGNAETQASVTNSIIQTDQLNVDAKNILIANQHLAGISAAVLGGGNAKVALLTDKNKTIAALNDTDINFRKNVDFTKVSVNAAHTLNTNGQIGAIGAGALAAVGTVNLNDALSQTRAQVKNSKIGTQEKSATEFKVNSASNIELKNNTGSISAGGASVGIGVSINTINDESNATVDQSEIFANRVSIDSEQNRATDLAASSISAASTLAAGTNIMITRVGSSEINTQEEVMEEKGGNKKTLDHVITTANDAGSIHNSNAELTNTVNSQKASLTTLPLVNNGVIVENSDIRSLTATVKATDKTNIKMNTTTVTAGTGYSINIPVAKVELKNNLVTQVAQNNIQADQLDISAGLDGLSELNIKQGNVGALAFGAGFATINDKAKALIALSNNNTTGMRYQVNVEDKSDNKVTLDALTVGVTGLASLTGKIKDDSSLHLHLKENNKIANEYFDAKVQNNTTDDVKTQAGSFGVLQGVGSTAEIENNAKSELLLGRNNTFNNVQTHFDITHNSNQKTNIDAVQVALAGATVSKSLITNKANTQLTLDQSNQINAQNLTISNRINSVLDSKGFASGKAAINATYNESKIENHASIKTLINANTYGSNTKLNLVNTNDSDANAAVKVSSGSIAGVGATKSSIVNHLDNTIDLIGKNGNSDDASQLAALSIQADSNAKSTLEGKTSTNGFIANKSNAIVYNDVKNKTDINVSGDWDVAEYAEFNAINKTNTNAKAEAGSNSALFSGSSASFANEDGKKSSRQQQNTITFKNGKIKANSLNVEAENLIADSSVMYTRSGGIIANSNSNQIGLDIQSNAKIDIATDSGKFDVMTNGVQNYNVNTATHEDGIKYTVTSKNDAGFTGGSAINTKGSIDATNEINVGTNASLISHNNSKINMHTHFDPMNMLFSNDMDLGNWGVASVNSTIDIDAFMNNKINVLAPIQNGSFITGGRDQFNFQLRSNIDSSAKLHTSINGNRHLNLVPKNIIHLENQPSLNNHYLSFQTTEHDVNYWNRTKAVQKSWSIKKFFSKSFWEAVEKVDNKIDKVSRTNTQRMIYAPTRLLAVNIAPTSLFSLSNLPFDTTETLYQSSTRDGDADQNADDQEEKIFY